MRARACRQLVLRMLRNPETGSGSFQIEQSGAELPSLTRSTMYSGTDACRYTSTSTHIFHIVRSAEIPPPERRPGRGGSYKGT